MQYLELNYKNKNIKTLMRKFTLESPWKLSCDEFHKMDWKCNLKMQMGCDQFENGGTSCRKNVSNYWF